MVEEERVIPPPFTEYVQLSQCFVDDTYGRPLIPSNLRRIRNGWDIRAVGTPYLSLRQDGKFAILDGAHRIAIARERGIQAMPCYVYIDLTHADEADLWAKFNTQSTAGKVDVARAKLEAGNSAMLQLRNVVRKHGLELNLKGKLDLPGHLNAPTAALAIATKYGLDVLDETLTILVELWGIESFWRVGPSRARVRPITHEVILGMGEFLNSYRHHPAYSQDHLLARLRVVMPQEITRQAQILKRQVYNISAPHAHAQTILEIYNQRLKSRRLTDIAATGVG